MYSCAYIDMCVYTPIVRTMYMNTNNCAYIYIFHLFVFIIYRYTERCVHIHTHIHAYIWRHRHEYTSCRLQRWIVGCCPRVSSQLSAGVIDATRWKKELTKNRHASWHLGNCLLPIAAKVPSHLWRWSSGPEGT